MMRQFTVSSLTSSVASLGLSRSSVHSALPYTTTFVFLVSLLFGGATQQGFWSDAIVQIASLVLLAMVLLSRNLVNVPRTTIFLVCMLVSLPALQLIPLPPSLWSALPGRDGIVQGYHAANTSLPWLPISLVPNMTWRSVFSLLPAIAILLATLCLPCRARRNLVLIVLAVAFVSVLLDLLQMMGGQLSPLRFYTITNTHRAVGFFANSNHNAAFLCCAIPFAAASAIALHRELYRVVGLGLLIAFFIIGLALTQSRAGIMLSVIAGLLCIPIVVANGADKGFARTRFVGFAVGGGLIALLIAFQFGFVNMVQRVESEDFTEDFRWAGASITSKNALANLPFGTGYGTFAPVYQTVEPLTLLTEKYVNRAHNDWLELGLEGGGLSVIGLLVFIVWFARSTFRAWQLNRNYVEHAALARAGSIGIVLLMLHSAVDYPLRTTAMTVIFALACSFLIGSKGQLTRPFPASKLNSLRVHRSSPESRGGRNMLVR
jgi:O-Antigen ligase